MIKSVLSILGPIMVGPSSSHTAGAVKLGRAAFVLSSGNVKKVEFILHGSFALTGIGHGTQKALLAGIMNFAPSDERIKKSYDVAKAKGIDYTFSVMEMEDVHPNTVKINVTKSDNSVVSLVGCSVGGGNIEINNINGVNCKITGDFPTIVISHYDRIGVLSKITMVFEEAQENIVTLTTTREGVGKVATTIVELDETPSVETIKALSKVNNIIGIETLSKL